MISCAATSSPTQPKVNLSFMEVCLSLTSVWRACVLFLGEVSRGRCVGNSTERSSALDVDRWDAHRNFSAIYKRNRLRVKWERYKGETNDSSSAGVVRLIPRGILGLRICAGAGGRKPQGGGLIISLRDFSRHGSIGDGCGRICVIL